jgi:hypothetical protein
MAASGFIPARIRLQAYVRAAIRQDESSLGASVAAKLSSQGGCGHVETCGQMTHARVLPRVCLQPRPDELFQIVER